MRVRWLAPTLGCLLLAAGACQQDTASGGGAGSGGSGRGGITAAGGTTGSAGRDGSTATGGTIGSGGSVASGGSASTGGTSSAGGAVGSGGSVASGGSASTGGTSGAGGIPSQPPNFATVREIVTATCGGSECHQPGDTQPTLVTDDAKLYANLLAFVAKKCGNHVLVKPGSPDESAFYLVQAGKCPDPTFKMPLGCVDRCTPPDYLEAVRQWIADGAAQR